MADLAASLGIPLDEWQEVALESAMGERKDGRWASKFVGISAPRQNGKSQLIVARALAGILLFKEKTIIVSAHQTDTAREVFQRLLDVIEENPALERRVSAVMKALNRESITFGVGADAQVIKIKARSQSGSRGFSADCLLLDEAQILGKRAWGSIVPTMSARPNPQLWLFGTPPTADDDPFAFSRVRESAKAGKARHTWLEWAAERDDDFDDEAIWAKANPSFGVRISAEACADDRAAMDDEQFAMERLGIWADEDFNVTRAVEVDAWSGLTISDPPITWPLAAVGVDMDLAGRLWVAVAAHADDPNVHVELLPYDPFTMGSEAAVQWLWERCGRRLPVVMPADSGAAVLVAPMQARGMTKNVYRLSPHEMCDASAGLAQMAADRTLSHLDDEVLAACVGESEREVRKPSGWRIARVGRTSSAPLLATACATHGAVKWSRRVDPNRSERRAVIL